MRVIIIFLSAMALLPTYLAFHAHGEVLFADNFEGEPDNSWLHFTNWSWEDGRLYYTGPCDNQRFLCGGGPGYSLYIISFDFCRIGESVELGFMAMSPLAPMPGVQPSGYEIFLSNDGYGFLATPGMILLESNNPQLLMQIGIPYRVEFGYTGGQICYRHWPLGADVPDWFWVYDFDGMFDNGFWYIFVNSYDTGSWIDNFIVEGEGAIPAIELTWGAIKLLYN